MWKRNQVIVNGVSTLDFSFKIVVNVGAGFSMPTKKSSVIETKYGSGGIVDDNNAWEPITKKVRLYCFTDNVADLRRVKMWASDSGTLILGDELDVYYEILTTSIGDATMETGGGFYLDVSFIVNPFGYEHNPQYKKLNNGDIFYHNTNAPMYPKIVIHGNSAAPTTLKIGNNLIQLKKLVDGLTIESKPLHQNVYDAVGVEQNAVMQGDFFEIQPGSENIVQFGPGITSIEMLDRRAWV